MEEPMAESEDICPKCCSASIFEKSKKTPKCEQNVCTVH